MSGLTARDQALRLNRITGSVVAAVLGYHPWMSPVYAAEAILGHDAFEGNDLTEMGSELERPLARIALKRLGGPDAVLAPGTVTHPRHEAWWAATADVLIPAWESGLQIKCQTPGAIRSYAGRPGEKGEYSNELIPPYHNLQCQWEMGVFGAKFWYLATFFNIADFRLYKISRDDELLEMMEDRAHAFWLRCIDPAGPQLPPDVPWMPEVGKGKEAPARKKTRADWITTPLGATP